MTAPDLSTVKIVELPPIIPIEQAAKLMNMSVKTYVRSKLPYTQVSERKRVVAVEQLVTIVKARAA